MSDYTKIVDCAAKDALTTDNPAKKVKGVEVGAEFDAIAVAVATKSNTASPTFTGTVTIPTPFTLGAVSVTPTGTELNFVDGVTSAIQTQLDAKSPIASPTFTGTVTIPTPFTLGAVSVTPTGTELNYVDGVTSNIQTQLDAKQASGATLTSLEGLSLVAGDILYATAADTLQRLAKGTASQLLAMNSGATAPEWIAASASEVTSAQVVSALGYTPSANTHNHDGSYSAIGHNHSGVYVAADNGHDNVGSLCWAGGQDTNGTTPGATVAGSALKAAGMVDNGTGTLSLYVSATTLTGTWRCLGHSLGTGAGTGNEVTLFQRIS